MLISLAIQYTLLEFYIRCRPLYQMQKIFSEQEASAVRNFTMSDKTNIHSIKVVLSG